MAEPERKDYLDLIRERRKEGRVSTPYQLVGLEIAEILKDDGHKSLYIKLAKEYDHEALLSIAKDVAERRSVKNKGGYFMRVFELKKKEMKKKK